MTEPSYRLVAVAGRCQGHGICVLRCPDALALDAWGYVDVLADDPLGGAALRRAWSAVWACPEGALHLLPAREEPVESPGDARSDRPGQVRTDLPARSGAHVPARKGAFRRARGA